MRILKSETAKQREQLVLRLIIQAFIETRKPVGSEFITKTGKLGLSSATIRNIMKKLEDEGYLYHSHTSGGRMPTDRAYRAYVDYLKEVQKYVLEERERIESQYHHKMDEIDSLMVQTTKMLAQISNSAGFVYTLDIKDQRLTRVDFVLLGPNYLLVIVITESGMVKHCPVKLSYSISTAKLRALSSFINYEISGLTLGQAQKKLWQYLNTGRPEFASVAEIARAVLSDLESATAMGDEVYIEGMGYLLEDGDMNHQEFRQMLAILEEKKRFSGLLAEKLKDALNAPEGESTSITIGTENELKELQNCSMVTCTYKVSDRPIGLIGVLGPKHMEYNKMIPLVNFISELMQNSLSEWESFMLSDKREDNNK